MNHLAGVWCDNRCAEYNPFFVGDNLDETIAKVRRIAAGDAVERRDGFVDGQIALQAVVLVQADVRDARIGKDNAGRSGVVRYGFGLV